MLQYNNTIIDITKAQIFILNYFPKIRSEDYLISLQVSIFQMLLLNE